MDPSTLNNPPAATAVVSSRQLTRRADTVGLLMRHSVTLVAVGVALADPASATTSSGVALLCALAGWSALRLATRSTARLPTGIDFIAVIAVCINIPQLLSDPNFAAYNTVPQVIAGTAVVSFSVVLPIPVSLPMTALIAAAYAWGAAGLIGWTHVGAVVAIYYFFLQWVTAAAIRVMLLRSARAVDTARQVRETAELRQRVSAAVREFDREQLALLHDTAASTLLIVGHGAAVPPSRLAAQAGRDLALLDEFGLPDDQDTIEIVSALRAEALLLTTPTQWAGLDHLWCDARVGRAVIGAAREAMNNVDRHARARTLSITVHPDRVMLADDGVGFNSHTAHAGHGLRESIQARTHRAGASATVNSVPGRGTVVELAWSTPTPPTAEPTLDSEKLITRTRRRYRAAMAFYAMANLVIAAVPILAHIPHPNLEITLLAVAGICALAAGSPVVQYSAARYAVIAVLLAVAALQPTLLPPETVGGQFNWTQNTVGWCAFPALLAIPVRTGAAILVALWSTGGIAGFLRHQSVETLLNIGLGTASILAVQLFALWFNHLLRDAATDAANEADAAHRLASRDRIDDALHAEYARRYATLIGDIVPLLQRLQDTGSVDTATQRQARSQSRRLRALFHQAATFDHPVLRALRPLLDDAEARHVDTAIEVSGTLPAIDEADDLTPMIDAVDTALSQATTSARIVIGAPESDGPVEVSVVCRDIPEGTDISQPPRAAGVEVDMVTSDKSAWFLIRYRHDQKESRCVPINGELA